jgi:hypothetical protein
MESFLLNEVKPKCTVGLTGGSDFKKIAYQMGGSEEGKNGFFVTEYLAIIIKNLCCAELFEILSIDQLPTSHVFRRVHIMQGSKFSTVYHQVSQVL